MTKLAFFGHNVNEPAVRKRARAFADCGLDLVGIMPHRGAPQTAAFDFVSLGQTRDNDYLSRLRPFLRSLRITPENHPELAGIDVIYARNLDMLACAHAFRWRNRLSVPIVYECLDIHRLMVARNPVSWVLRRLEAALLRRSELLVYSSNRYRQVYFDVYHPGRFDGWLVENRLNSGDVRGRPSQPRTPDGSKLKLGWIGNLRCRRSLDLLCQLGNMFHDRLEIHVHGYPARSVFPDFEDELERAKGITYHGRYDSAVDLPRIYSSFDIVWAGDWFEAERNSIWQIPNRIYEGGYYGVPAIGSLGTETGQKIMSWKAGWLFGEPANVTAPELMESLLNNRDDIREKSRTLLDLPVSHFVETPDETRKLVNRLVPQTPVQET